MRQDSTNLGDLTRNFVHCLESEGKSPKTIEFYSTALKRLDIYLRKHSLAADVRDIGVEELRGYLHHLQYEARRWETIQDKDHGQLSLHSVHGHGRAIKAFWSWLATEGYVDENLLGRLKLPRLPRIIIETFSREQINALLSACKKNEVHGNRNYAIVLLLLDTGLRLSELINLTVEDIDFDNSSLIVTGKGKKERIVPFGSQVRRNLRRYLIHQRPDPESPIVKQVFLTYEGYPLKPRGVQSMIRRLGRDAGIDNVRCSPHTFRHTFAKRYLMNGGDIFSLQKILGHSSLEVVKMYLHLDSGDVMDRYRQFSPIDNLEYGGR